MIFTKIVISNYHEKLQQFSFMFFSEIQMIKDVCKKPVINPDSLGVKFAPESRKPIRLESSLNMIYGIRRVS